MFFLLEVRRFERQWTPERYRPMRLEDAHVPTFKFKSLRSSIASRRAVAPKRQPLHKWLATPEPPPGLDSRGRRAWKRQYVMRRLQLHDRRWFSFALSRNFVSCILVAVVFWVSLGACTILIPSLKCTMAVLKFLDCALRRSPAKHGLPGMDYSALAKRSLVGASPSSCITDMVAMPTY